jgi:type IV secretory pathway VirB4 component
MYIEKAISHRKGNLSFLLYFRFHPISKQFDGKALIVFISSCFLLAQGFTIKQFCASNEQ